MLDQQGFYGPDDILPAGVKVDLQRQFNISTGGDSIDVTGSMHPSYKELAADMARLWEPGPVALISSSATLLFPQRKIPTVLHRAQLQSFLVYTPIVLRARTKHYSKILAKLSVDL